MPTPAAHPTPQRFFEAVTMHPDQALKTAIELDVFTAIGEGAQSAEAIANRCHASVRGVRILCDYLSVLSFLTKENGHYGLAADSAMFLDRRSPAYLGSAVNFLMHPQVGGRWTNLTEAVRKGGAVDDTGTLGPEDPIWVEFARSMAPLMAAPAEALAKHLKAEEGHKWKVLGLAVGHGLYGITLARQNPHAELWVVDWPNVLQVAQENAIAAGIGNRYHTIPGSAFEVEYGSGYDLVLIPNFLHHFDPPTCEKLLRKAHAALKPGGRVIILEIVPNEDRVSPRTPAAFSMVMLVSTPHGDAYTYPELQQMLHNAGYRTSERHTLLPDFMTLVVGHK